MAAHLTVRGTHGGPIDGYYVELSGELHDVRQVAARLGQEVLVLTPPPKSTDSSRVRLLQLALFAELHQLEPLHVSISSAGPVLELLHHDLWTFLEESPLKGQLRRVPGISSSTFEVKVDGIELLAFVDEAQADQWLERGATDMRECEPPVEGL